MTSPTQQFMPVKGLRLDVDDRGGGSPVVFCNGFSTCMPVWEPQMRDLSAAYRTVNWDYPGHGRSDAYAQVEDYSIERLVTDLAGLLDALSIERAVIGGLSLGGQVAMRFGLEHPDRTRALILCDTGPGFKNPEGLKLWARQCGIMAARLEQRGMTGFRERTGLMGGVQYLDDDDLRARLHVADMAQNPEALAHFGRRILVHPHIIDRIGDLAMPTLVIVGDEDAPFHRSAEMMEARIPNARRVVIPRAAHIANLDNAPAVTAAMREFLNSLAVE